MISVGIRVAHRVSRRSSSSSNQARRWFFRANVSGRRTSRHPRHEISTRRLRPASMTLCSHPRALHMTPSVSWRGAFWFNGTTLAVVRLPSTRRLGARRESYASAVNGSSRNLGEPRRAADHGACEPQPDRVKLGVLKAADCNIEKMQWLLALAEDVGASFSVRRSIRCRRPSEV